MARFEYRRNQQEEVEQKHITRARLSRQIDEYLKKGGVIDRPECSGKTIRLKEIPNHFDTSLDELRFLIKKQLFVTKVTETKKYGRADDNPAFYLRDVKNFFKWKHTYVNHNGKRVYCGPGRVCFI